MITANRIRIEPTIFPDQTSQVWKLPSKLRDAYDVNVVWDFESEREIIDLLSLRRLLYSLPMSLHMPFMPYARQDKKAVNTRTFNLEVLADLLNGMRLSDVSAVDVHNPKRTAALVKNFRNIQPSDFHCDVFNLVEPDVIVFPDEGASKRYNMGGRNTVVMQKNRDEITGKILNMCVEPHGRLMLGDSKKVLIVDDICDGGATFVMCARALRALLHPIVPEIHLAVTHGIFSRGVKPLEDQGIHIHCHRFLKLNRGVE